MRSIARHFLSSADLPTPRTTALRPRDVVVAGRGDSPWPAVLAVNLALAAWRGGEPCDLLLPPARLPGLARLLGAGAEALGLDWSPRAEPWGRPLEPLAGLRLLPANLRGLLPEEGRGWRLRLGDADGERGPRLALLEAPTDPLPGGGRGDPLFLLGLGFQPRERPGVTGVWGPLARTQLLDTGRGGGPALLPADARLLNRYAGFLEALRRHHGAATSPDQGVKR